MKCVLSATIIGVEAQPVMVEVDVRRQIGGFQIVGLPDATVKEARERICSALHHSEFRRPRGRITVNLAPADIKKQGPYYDLPIALCILMRDGTISQNLFDQTIIVGELSLDGQIRPVNGVLSIALMTKRIGAKRLIVPEKNKEEAGVVRGINVIPTTSLRHLIKILGASPPVKPWVTTVSSSTEVPIFDVDMKYVKGQEHAKRALEIAAAGGHNVLLKGPPGTGKTMLARALISILPTLGEEESMEVTSIASIAGILPSGNGLIRTRPFRSPHHSSSAVSIVGGGTIPKPGEVSLAHRGVLFLDELPEFPRHVLETLRQPLEDGFVNISRAAQSVRFPSRFLLAATMNPCPCGYASDPTHPCLCSVAHIHHYQKKISGPLLDRFDLIIEVPSIDPEILLAKSDGEPSEIIRKRVQNARTIQKQRLGCEATNAEMKTTHMESTCLLDESAQTLLRTSMKKHGISARGYTRVLKVARTIADLEHSQNIQPLHLAEALQYRLRQ